MRPPLPPLLGVCAARDSRGHQDAARQAERSEETDGSLHGTCGPRECRGHHDTATQVEGNDATEGRNEAESCLSKDEMQAWIDELLRQQHSHAAEMRRANEDNWRIGQANEEHWRRRGELSLTITAARAEFEQERADLKGKRVNERDLEKVIAKLQRDLQAAIAAGLAELERQKMDHEEELQKQRDEIEQQKQDHAESLRRVQAEHQRQVDDFELSSTVANANLEQMQAELELRRVQEADALQRELVKLEREVQEACLSGQAELERLRMAQEETLQRQCEELEMQSAKLQERRVAPAALCFDEPDAEADADNAENWDSDDEASGRQGFHMRVSEDMEAAMMERSNGLALDSRPRHVQVHTFLDFSECNVLLDGWRCAPAGEALAPPCVSEPIETVQHDKDVHIEYLTQVLDDALSLIAIGREDCEDGMQQLRDELSEKQRDMHELARKLTALTKKASSTRYRLRGMRMVRKSAISGSRTAKGGRGGRLRIASASRRMSIVSVLEATPTPSAVEKRGTSGSKSPRKGRGSRGAPSENGGRDLWALALPPTSFFAAVSETPWDATFCSVAASDGAPAMVRLRRRPCRMNSWV